MSRCDRGVDLTHLRLMSIENAYAYTQARRRTMLWNRLFFLGLLTVMSVAVFDVWFFHGLFD